MMNQALEGITVLDFTQLLQGPYATQMFGDLGADVIKVERPGSGDLYRSMTFFNKWMDGHESPCFLAWNRNKRSLALDLKHPDGLATVLELVKSADVVVENFRPGVMNKLGLGYQAVAEINPGLVYCSASGWGSNGPYVDRPGQDLLVQGLSGAMYASGRAEDGPVPLGTALSDQLGALHVVYATMAALLYKQRTGVGQLVEVNLLQSVLAFSSQDFFTVQNLHRTFERPSSGIAHPGNGAPFGVYQTKDGYLSIAMNPWQPLVEVLGDARLEQYADPQVRFERRDEVFASIQAMILTKPTSEWLTSMLARDLWVAEVLRQDQVSDDPQVKHLGAFTEVYHPRAGTVKVVNIPVHLSQTPGEIRRPAPLVGQHSVEILRERGFDPTAISRLVASGAVVQRDEDD